MNLLQFYSNPYYEDYYVQSDKDGRTHLVTIDKVEQSIHCDCEDFKFRKENLRFGGVSLQDKANHCKHIRWCLQIREVIRDE